MEIGWIDTPEEWRDLFIMMYMVAGTITFLLAIFFTLIIGFLSSGLLMRTRGLVKDSVVPTLENVRATSENVRGASREMRTTITFVSDHAIMPVIRVYGTAAAARRFVAVFAKPKKSS
jgi:hypothetical protein